jgi:cell wall-associated NlpC family hydrolase
MVWTDTYIGIPFKKNGNDRLGIDCWRLVVLVYKEVLGISLPLFDGIYVEKTENSLLSVTKLMKSEKEKWTPIKRPEKFALVLLRTGRMLYHCGVAVSNRTMLHVDVGFFSVIESFDNIIWKNKVEGFYRYAKK